MIHDSRPTTVNVVDMALDDDDDNDDDQCHGCTCGI